MRGPEMQDQNKTREQLIDELNEMCGVWLKSATGGYVMGERKINVAGCYLE